MRKVFLFIILSFFALKINADPIDKETALLVANNFLSARLKNTTANLTLVYECKSQKQNAGNFKQAENLILYYVYNSEKGFIIVSGDDAVYPILGYSDSGTFDANNLPPNFRKWLENYKKQINYIISNGIKATEEITSEWQDIIQKKKSIKSTKSVSPLISTAWGQSPYVNDLCPFDINAGSGNGYHAVTGCPATAMAQIMKYWNYPEQGTGFHSYNHPTYGTLSANFGNTTYDWASMPDIVNSTNNAVATLMYHCGIAVEMQYGPTSSASYVIMSGYYPDEQTSEYAYKTYFGYDPTTIRGLIRENYSDTDWKQLLKSDLDKGMPIQYAGFGLGSGHTFVCDGYDSDDFFHMNWGWGEDYISYNGFYNLDALNPGPGGIGAGGGMFNDGQQAIIGIKPPDGNITYNLTLYDNLTVTPSPISYGQGFTVHTDITNSGVNSFSGDYCAAIFDNDYNFIDYVEIKTGYSLQSNYHYTNGLDFTTTGLLAVLPGTYYIGVFYRPTDGDWKIINNGSYANLIQLDVEYNNDIALYSDITVSTTDITQGQSFSVNVDIANYGTTDFSGSYSVDLYNLTNGIFVENIGTKTGMTLGTGYHYTNGLTFSSGDISAEPGTYLLAVSHLEDGQDWELSGSQNYTNPIKVIVKAAPLQADIFENNNTDAEAYNLPVTFSGNTATILTTGSNNHIGSDLDYYKIILPTGYDYSLTVRAHDSYNSSNGQTYSNDIGWSYLYNSLWSDVYDDVMPTPIAVNNGGTLIFNVSPYFVGSSGTYLLDISINRTELPNLTVSTNSLSIAAPTNSTKTFNITSNTSWTVASNQTWLTLSSASGSNNATITLTAQKNPTTTTRNATVTVTGTGVTAKTITVTQDASATGINEPGNSRLAVFPNPAKDFINIEISNSDIIQRIELFDITGKLVLSNSLINKLSKITVPTENLKNGTYSLTIRYKDGIESRKIIVAR